MAVYSYCIALAHERERLYETTTLVEQTMQRKGSKHLLFIGVHLSAVHLNISFKHTSTREMSELVRLKTGYHIDLIAQANLHFGELIISIIVVSKIDENCCKQTLASLP